MTRQIRAVLGVALLSACVAQPRTVTLDWSPDDGGITVAGTGQEVGFGRAISGALPAISALVGSDPVDRSDRGSCTVHLWPDGFEIHAADKAFVGWRDPRARSGRTEAGRFCPA